MLPRVIHQYWHSPNVPPEMRAVIDANLALNPGFDHHLVDEALAESYLRDRVSAQSAAAFAALIPQAYKSDLWRVAVLANEGGVYLDVKVRMAVSFASLLDWPGQINDGLLVAADLWRGCIWNAVIAAPPHHPLFERALELIIDNVRERRYGINALDITGPQVLGRAYNQLSGAVWNAKIPYGSGQRCPMRLRANAVLRDSSDRVIAQSNAYPEYRTRDATFAAGYELAWRGRSKVFA